MNESYSVFKERCLNVLISLNLCQLRKELRIPPKDLNPVVLSADKTLARHATYSEFACQCDKMF